MNTINEITDIQVANKQLQELNTVDRIKWAHENFLGRLAVISSFGVDSALMLNLVKQSGVDISVVTIDTGFWFPQTYDFKQELTKKLDLDVQVYGPKNQDIGYIENNRLWETDIDHYHEITKHEPLRRAIKELGLSAILSGVRSDQTVNRQTMNFVSPGNDQEFKIHPVLDWPERKVDSYFETNKLPKNPLYYLGYDSVGDWTTTEPGKGRSGRSKLGEHLECGLHLLPVNG